MSIRAGLVVWLSLTFAGCCNKLPCGSACRPVPQKQPEMRVEVSGPSPYGNRAVAPQGTMGGQVPAVSVESAGSFTPPAGGAFPTLNAGDAGARAVGN